MRTLWWEDGALWMIDQRKLPTEYEIVTLVDCHDVAQAIKEMVVRGAPAIGVAAAFGLALAAQESDSVSRQTLMPDLEVAARELLAARPTAVNLRWAVDRMMRVAREDTDADVDALKHRLLAEAQALADEDVDINRRIGHNGAALIHDGSRVLTHCNTGALATVDYGTALGVIRAAVEQGKQVSVLADETRPLFQGARLTAWELMRDGIPVTLIADSAAGHFLRRREVDIVLVGADCIAANGDVVNKIGTYNLAVLAKENEVPFYSVAPVSTIDLSVPTGDDISIEERAAEEVTHIAGVQIAPDGVNVANPAFDVTPHRYVTAIVTENGIACPPFEFSLRRVVTQQERVGQ
jgi:methylthioribose-1-phosphate isomerase